MRKQEQEQGCAKKESYMSTHAGYASIRWIQVNPPPRAFDACHRGHATPQRRTAPLIRHDPRSKSKCIKMCFNALPTKRERQVNKKRGCTANAQATPSEISKQPATCASRTHAPTYEAATAVKQPSEKAALPAPRHTASARAGAHRLRRPHADPAPQCMPTQEP